MFTLEEVKNKQTSLGYIPKEIFFLKQIHWNGLYTLFFPPFSSIISIPTANLIWVIPLQKGHIHRPSSPPPHFLASLFQRPIQIYSEVSFFIFLRHFIFHLVDERGKYSFCCPWLYQIMNRLTQFFLDLNFRSVPSFEKKNKVLVRYYR